MSNLWIIHDAQQDNRSVRLFCFPFAGGGASIFRDWPAAAPDFLQICRVQLPGRENRLAEPAFTELVPLITQLINELYPLMHNKRFAFFGHSMGGIVAFEVCRQLAELGEPLPEKVFLSATRPPHLVDPKPIHHLEEQEFIRALQQRGGTPDEILTSPVFREIFAPTLRHDLAIAESWYAIDLPALPVPLVIFNGCQDSIVKAGSADTWCRYSSIEPQIVTFDGGHFFIHSHAQEVRQAVFSRLHDFPVN